MTYKFERELSREGLGRLEGEKVRRRANWGKECLSGLEERIKGGEKRATGRGWNLLLRKGMSEQILARSNENHGAINRKEESRKPGQPGLLGRNFREGPNTLSMDYT